MSDTQSTVRGSTTRRDSYSSETPTRWTGLVVFAACMMWLLGFFQAIAGFAAIVNPDYYQVTSARLLLVDSYTAWGWIHLLLGVLVITGFGLFSRSAWAGVTAIMLAMLSAVVNFFLIPYYPFWSILVIALDVWVIWALTRPGAIET